jgi:hypothetical protein
MVISVAENMQGFQVNKNIPTGVDYSFLNRENKKGTSIISNVQKPKASKSNDKYQTKGASASGPPLKDRNDSQGKNVRYESI